MAYQNISNILSIDIHRSSWSFHIQQTWWWFILPFLWNKSTSPMKFLQISITKCPKNPWGQRPYANRSQRNHPYQGRGTWQPSCLGKIYHQNMCFFFGLFANQMLVMSFSVIFWLVGWFGGRGFLRFAWFHDWPWWKSRVGFNKKMDELSTFYRSMLLHEPGTPNNHQLCQLDDEPNLYIGNGCLSISIHF